MREGGPDVARQGHRLKRGEPSYARSFGRYDVLSFCRQHLYTHNTLDSRG